MMNLTSSQLWGRGHGVVFLCCQPANGHWILDICDPDLICHKHEYVDNGNNFITIKAISMSSMLKDCYELEI